MPSIKGTASVTDARARSKALKATRFPSCFSKTLDLEKINKPVLTQWIEQKVTSILGFDDEIVSSMAINLFLPSEGESPDPRRAQLDLAGFLGEGESALFAKELWNLMIEAESSSTGIPRTLLEQKKKELSQQKAAAVQPPLAMLPAQQQPSSSRHRNPELNRFVQEAARRAHAARQMVGAPENGAVGDEAPVPIPIPVSPPHHPEPSSSPKGAYKADPNDDNDRKMNPREISARSDLPLPPPPLPDSSREGGECPARASGSRASGRQFSSSRSPGSRSAERNRQKYRNDDRRGVDSERRHRSRSGGRDSRRHYSTIDDEIEDLERRLSVLKKRVTKREDYAEIEDLKDRIRQLERRRRRERERNDEEYRRRRPESHHRRRSRSRSSDEESSAGRRGRSPSSGSSDSSSVSSSSSSSTDSYGRKKPKRRPSGERGRERSHSGSRNEGKRRRSPSTSSGSSSSSSSDYSEESR